MAEAGICLGILTALTIFSAVSARRFGSISKTLHMPALSQAEEFGKRFMIIEAPSLKEQAAKENDDVDQLLNRIRRDTSSSSTQPSSRTDSDIESSVVSIFEGLNYRNSLHSQLFMDDCDFEFAALF